MPFKTRSIHSCIEIRRTPGPFIVSHAEITVFLIDTAGLFPVIRIHFTAFIQEKRQPVIAVAVGFHRCSGTGRDLQLLLCRNHLLCPFDDPVKHSPPGMLHQIICIILDIGIALDLRLERDDNQPLPDARIRSPYLIRVKNEFFNF